MKKISLFLFWALLACVCFAQTAKPKMYVVAFADIDDKKIGAGEEKNLKHFDQFIGVIRAQLNGFIDVQDVDEYAGGIHCSKNSLVDWMNEFSCGSNDVVVFAYMGHGTRSTKDDRTQFPQMCLGSTYDADFVNLEWVKNQLLKKNPRLCVVLGDCCNNYGQNVSNKPLVQDPDVTLASCSPNDNHVQALKTLFCDSYGSVIASGSKPGEYSWINTDTSDKVHAGFFMDAFIRAVNAVSSSSNNNLWDNVFQKVASDPSFLSIKDVDGNIYTQHPIYKVDVRNTPNNRPPIIDYPDPIIEKTPLSKALLSIGDDRIDSRTRVKNIDIVFDNYFADGALVYFVSEHGRSLETMWVKDYLVELSTKALFRGVVIRSTERNSQGKITKIALHEIFDEKPPFEEF